MKRAALKAMGVLSVVTGAVGVFVPGLPTTVFLLVASYCFARSSPELHRRLLEHRLLGRYIQVYEREKAMPLRAKVVSLTLMWTAIVAGIRFSPKESVAMAILALGIAGTCVVVFYVRTSRPSSPRARVGTTTAGAKSTGGYPLGFDQEVTTAGSSARR